MHLQLLVKLLVLPAGGITAISRKITTCVSRVYRYCIRFKHYYVHRTGFTDAKECHGLDSLTIGTATTS